MPTHRVIIQTLQLSERSRTEVQKSLKEGMSTLGFCWSRETEQPKSLWLLSKQTASSWCHKRLHVTLGKASTTEAVKGSPVSMHGHKSQGLSDRGSGAVPSLFRRFVHSVRGGFYRRGEDDVYPSVSDVKLYFSSY